MSSKPGNLRVERKRVDGGSIVRLVGSLDYVSSTLLTQAVADLLAEARTNICIDLSAVQFISSSGVAALVRVKRLLEKRGGRLLLLCPSAVVRTIFDLTRVVEYFEVFPDEGEALAALADSR